VLLRLPGLLGLLVLGAAALAACNAVSGVDAFSFGLTTPDASDCDALGVCGTVTDLSGCTGCAVADGGACSQEYATCVNDGCDAGAASFAALNTCLSCTACPTSCPATTPCPQ
jgi:hypothetical protein